MKTLAFIQTHIITDGIISELKKLKAAENEHLKVALFIDNSNNIVQDGAKTPVQELELGGVKVPALLCYEQTLRDFKLIFGRGYSHDVSMASCMWANGDYTFYIMRRYFPDFDFYWHFDNDCFYNDSDYTSFFAPYDDDKTDFIISHFRKEAPDSKWIGNASEFEWAYDKNEFYGSFFPVERMSARLVDVLYERRIWIGEEFKKPSAQRKMWVSNELFCATECMRLGFSAKSLQNSRARFRPEYDLNETRLFEKPDKCLYHPIKGDFIKRLETKQSEIKMRDDEIKRLKKLEHFSNFVKFYTRKQLKKFFNKLQTYLWR